MLCLDFTDFGTFGSGLLIGRDQDRRFHPMPRYSTDIDKAWTVHKEICLSGHYSEEQRKKYFEALRRQAVEKGVYADWPEAFGVWETGCHRLSVKQLFKCWEKSMEIEVRELEGFLVELESDLIDASRQALECLIRGFTPALGATVNPDKFEIALHQLEDLKNLTGREMERKHIRFWGDLFSKLGLGSGNTEQVEVQKNVFSEEEITTLQGALEFERQNVAPFDEENGLKFDALWDKLDVLREKDGGEL